jgi:hypothetical protein
MQATATKQASNADIRRDSHSSRTPVPALELLREQHGRRSSQKAFVIWCPVPTVESGLAEAIYALSYLPENFVLMIPRKSVNADEIPMVIASSPLANRIRFYEAEDSPQSESSLMVDAVIAGDMHIPKVNAPVVVVSMQQHGITENAHGYTVSPTPEAIASALLNIARK